MANSPELLVREGLVEHLPKFRRFALVLARNPADADDLVQAGLERALVRAASYNPAYRLESWVFKIIQNHWIDQMRKTERQGPHDDISAAYSLVGEDGRERLEVLDMSAKARIAIEALPDDQRAVVGLILVNGESYQDAANVLDLPVGTVMSRLYRARQKLIGVLEPSAPEGTLQ